MWFFMILCYVMTALSFLFLFLTGMQGHFKFFIFNANHATFALFTIIIYLFTETLVIFYFVGIGVSIKEYIQGNKTAGDYYRRMLTVKRKVYPPLLLNMGLVMTLFILGGAVDTKHIPGWIHGGLFYISMLHFLKTIVVQHQAFKESTAIVIEMAAPCII